MSARRRLAGILGRAVVVVTVLVVTVGCPQTVQDLGSSCTSDGECAVGAICSSFSQVCVSSCRDNLGCSGDLDLCSRTGDAESGECVECITALTDCNPGEACVAGRCRQCENHDQCLPTEICSGGSCLDITGDVRVNQTTEGDQYQPAIAVSQSGEFVVVWQDSFYEDWGIFAQRVESSGSLVGSEIPIGTSAFDSPHPDVARESAFSARFVVVWRDGSSVIAQRFSGTGTAEGGPIVVSAPGLPVGGPAVAMNEEGFVVVWARLELGGDGWEIQGRLYDAGGMALGNEFPVNTTSADRQTGADVAIDLEDHFVVVWESRNQDGDGYGVYGQWFSAGAPVGGEFPVNTTTVGDQARPAVAMDPFDASFVVAWVSAEPGQLSDIFGQRFSFGGTPDGSEFQVNATLAQSFAPAVAMAGGGAFAVTWDRWDDATRGEILTQRFLSGGAPSGGETLVNVFTPDNQRDSAVALDVQNTVLGVAWSSYRQDRSGFGVFGQFGLAAPAATATSGDQSLAMVPVALEAPALPMPSPRAAGPGFSYASRPEPTVTLLPAAPGGSSEHELSVSVHPGELETYTASWGYPADFAFAGFTAVGPIGSIVGRYLLDIDLDGVPEVERPLVSLGNDSAYADLDDDGDPIGNPLLVRGDGPGPQFYLVAPYGGDGDPSTLTVPVESRMTLELMPGILLNPVAPGTYTVAIRLVSVDPDTDDMDDGAGLSPLEASGEIDIFLAAPAGFIFADGFESGTTSAWTATVP